MGHGFVDAAIFLCYARQDEVFASQIDSDLGNLGLSSYYSRRFFPSGGDWRPAVHYSVQNAKAVLVLLVDQVLSSERCLEEISIAVANGVLLLVLNRGLIDRRAVGNLFEAQVWLDFTDAELYKRLLADLVEHIGQAFPLKPSPQASVRTRAANSA